MRDAEKHQSHGTLIYILAKRLALGDGMIRDAGLAVELHKKAVNTNDPIPGGYPGAMFCLATHYDKGIGVDKDQSEAFDWYKKVLEHPFPGEENTQPTFVALSRYYREGLGRVSEPSLEMARKYEAFSESNAENQEELQDLEMWWQTTGRDLARAAGVLG